MSAAPLPPSSPAKGKRWLSELVQARLDAQLLCVRRRYLSSIRRCDVEALPLACRPIPLEDATDLSAYASQLVRYRCEVDQPSLLVLCMAAFFAHANVRMARILWQMNDAAEADSILAHIGRPHPGNPSSQSPASAGDAGRGASAESN